MPASTEFQLITLLFATWQAKKSINMPKSCSTRGLKCSDLIIKGTGYFRKINMHDEIHFTTNLYVTPLMLVSYLTAVQISCLLKQ